MLTSNVKHNFKEEIVNRMPNHLNTVINHILQTVINLISFCLFFMIIFTFCTMITRPLREDGMLFIFCAFCVLWYLVSFFAAGKSFHDSFIVCFQFCGMFKLQESIAPSSFKFVLIHTYYFAQCKSRIYPKTKSKNNNLSRNFRREERLCPIRLAVFDESNNFHTELNPIIEKKEWRTAHQCQDGRKMHKEKLLCVLGYPKNWHDSVHHKSNI